jgi:hypothetical protein
MYSAQQFRKIFGELLRYSPNLMNTIYLSNVKIKYFLISKVHFSLNK